MTPEYLTQRYYNRLYEYWFSGEHDLQMDDEQIEDFLMAFTIDNCVLQYEGCLEHSLQCNDWVRYCYPDAKCAQLARKKSMEAAMRWKLENWFNE